jgi:hypothetical protein
VTSVPAYPPVPGYYTCGGFLVIARALTKGTSRYAGTSSGDRLADLYERFKAAPKGTKERRHLRRAVEREARRRVERHVRDAAQRVARGKR